jgi:tRNA nucleotidyltransferase (CCA-adding enzyme)
MTNKKSRCFGGIIKCSSTGKYLLVKGFTGKWSFPKGHMEKNESALDCAKREIYEETGIKIENFNSPIFKCVSIHRYFTIDFETEISTQPIDTKEIIDIKWFSPQETTSIEKNKDVRIYFDKILKKQLII